MSTSTELLQLLCANLYQIKLKKDLRNTEMLFNMRK